MSLMADKSIEMVVVDGVRYRPEDAPKAQPKTDEKQADKPKNKARSAQDAK